LEEIFGEKQKKVVLREEQFAIVLNPYDKNKRKPIFGDREVRVGPCIFPLYPGEKLDKTHLVGTNNLSNGVKSVYILERKQGLVVKALKDFEDRKISRKAGDEWIINGPKHYIPQKYELVQRTIEEISLAEHSGIYIKNTKTGEIRLEQGAKNIILTPDEELYKKEYTTSEKDAIKFVENFDWSTARPLWVLEDEVTKIMSETKQSIIFGPKVIMLGPFERPYVMTISGGTPKGSQLLKRWKLTIGPRFVSDVLDVRTKDNAVLQIRLRYKTRFKVDPEDPNKLFSVSDFIGLATQTMAGLIRDESAKHDFEDLHSKATTIIKDAIFGGNDSYLFQENGFEIFDIDIKEIIPKDCEIAQKMNNAIKSNMEIYVNKMEQNAKIEAERTLIDGKKMIEKEKQELLELENENLRTEEIIKADIEAETIIKRAEAEAESIRIKKTTEKEVEIAKIKDIIATINNDGKNYLKLQQILSLESIKKMAIIPTNSQMFLPIKDIIKEIV
jgi:major vault protein